MARRRAGGRAGSAGRRAPRRTRPSRPGRGRGAPPRCRRSRRRPRAPCPRAPAASAISFTSGSRRFGMNAVMPPIACAPRLWQVRTSSSVYARMNGTVIVTCARSGSTNSAAVAELLDDREDVVPAAGVEPGAVVAQLVEDLVHLERGEDRLDQHGRADRAVRDAERVLREGEDVVPQPRLEVALELRQVEVRPRPALEQALARCGRSRGRSRTSAGRDGLAVDLDVPSRQVPAARPHHDRRRPRRSAR